VVCLALSISGLAQDSSLGSTATPATKKSSKTPSSKPASSAKTHSAAHSANSSHSKTAVASSKTKRVSSRKSGKKKARGQQKIDSERAQAIQEALIREHYLNGEPTGTWNQASEDAMRKYQADHGWQSKTVPDSRALISLGLGPSKDHLLNPESAMTSEPVLPRAASAAPVSHSAQPGAPIDANSSSQTPASTPGKDASVPQ
jgi:hypothetical protein